MLNKKKNKKLYYLFIGVILTSVIVKGIWYFLSPAQKDLILKALKINNFIKSQRKIA